MRFARLAFYAALGPITGPLVAGIVRHWRTAPVLAALYALAIPPLLFDATQVLGPLVRYQMTKGPATLAALQGAIANLQTRERGL